MQLLCERGKGRFDTEDGNVTTEARYYTPGFEDGRQDHSQDMQRIQVLEAIKGKEMFSPLELKHGPANALIST